MSGEWFAVAARAVGMALFAAGTAFVVAFDTVEAAWWVEVLGAVGACLVFATAAFAWTIADVAVSGRPVEVEA